MRTQQRNAVLLEQRLARDRTEVCHDARARAIEFARGEPSARFGPLKAGAVLQPREIGYWQVPIWVRVQDDGQWADASSAKALVTDQRLLCRFVAGRLASPWWNGVFGLHGVIDDAHLPDYLDEFVFPFTARRSRRRGLLFYRVLQLAVDHDPVRCRDLIAHPQPEQTPRKPPDSRGHPRTLERPPAGRPRRASDQHHSG